MIDITIIPIIEDNYAYFLQSSDGTTAILDPGEAAPIISLIEERNLTLDYILLTHHHWDHVNGIPALKQKYNPKVVAPEKQKDRIKGVDQTLSDGDLFQLGNEKARVIETSGHTIGEICYYFADSKALFTGDTLFSMGCGRLFEGSAKDMFHSFQKISTLPDDTLIYCGHEYTRGNAGFCLTQDKGNPHLQKRIEDVKDLRAQNKPTIPVTLELEKKTNVFMKAKSADEFSALRKLKDNF